MSKQSFEECVIRRLKDADRNSQQSFHGSNIFRQAAGLVERQHQRIDELEQKLRRCKAVMECNDPGNYALIFGQEQSQ